MEGLTVPAGADAGISGGQDPLAAAAALLAQHDPGRALAAFDDVLAREPGSVPAQAGRVQALWMLRRAEEARADLAELSGTAGDEAQVQIAVGMVALGLRDDPALLDSRSGSCDADLDLAATSFQAALRADPTSVPATRGLATVFRLTERFRDAQDLLDGALAAGLPRAPLLLERAQCALDQWRIPAALADLQEALDAAPYDVEVVLAWCRALSEFLGWSTDAMTQFTAFTDGITSHSPELDESRGWLLTGLLIHTADPTERAQLRDRAEAAFSATLRAEPRHAGALCGLAQLTRDRSGVDAALARVERALRDDPRSPQLCQAKAWYLVERLKDDDADRALDSFQVAVDQSPYLPSAWSGLVYAAELGGRSDVAARIQEELDRRFPGHPAALHTASFLATRQGRHRRAVELAEQGLLVDPDEAASALQRADALLAAGCLGEASDEDDPLAAAIARWPGHVGLLWQQVLRADAEGRLHEAIAGCRTILSLDKHDPTAEDFRRQLVKRLRRRPLYRLVGRHLDEVAVGSAAQPAEERAAVAEFVGADHRLDVVARLRALRWRTARLEAASVEGIRYELWLALILLGGVAVVALPWFGRPVGVGASWWTLLWAALALAAYAAYWSAVNVGSSRTIVPTGVVVAVLLAVAVAPDAAQVRPVVEATSLVPAAVVILQLGVLFGLLGLQTIRQRRLCGELADAVLIRDLLAVLAKVRSQPVSWTLADRRDLARLLESVAQAQGKVVRRAAAEDRDRSLTAYAEHRARAVAAATRDLKQQLVVWEARTPARLFRRINRLLQVACAGEWGRFPHRPPRPEPARPRWSRLQLAGRVGMMVAVAGLGVWLILLSRQQTDQAASLLTALTGLVTASAPVVAPLIERGRTTGSFGRHGGESPADLRPSINRH